MRLRRFWIDRYLMLRDLDLTFDRPGRLDTGEYALDFLVGVNGSGKTTVLRALAEIIADLRADRVTGHNYRLDYQLAGRDGPYFVEIEQAQEADGVRRHMIIRRGSPEEPPFYDEDAIDQSYLPSRLIVYTTGSETEWERLITRATADGDTAEASDEVQDDPVRRSIMELPGHLPRTRRLQPIEAEEEAKPPYLLVRASRLPLVTLCGLLAHLASEGRPLEEVVDSIWLQHVRGFSLRFRIHSALSPQETFNALKPFATRHIQQGNDHLFVFDLVSDPELASRLIENPDIGGSLALFEKLDRLLDPDLSGSPTLRQVNLFLERERPPIEDEEATENDEIPQLFLLDWLSDGEQSFLGRMALLAMLETEDSLIFFDEPEVHFNDYWKREIVNLLDAVMRDHSNHMLIATHSSIVLSDVTDAHITTLIRNEFGWAERIEFDAPTFGADPSSIMIHVFDTGTAVGAFSARYLADALERDDMAELQGLLEKVGLGYWYFRILNRLEKTDAS